MFRSRLTPPFSVSAQDPNDAFQWQGNTGSGFQNLQRRSIRGNNNKSTEHQQFNFGKFGLHLPLSNQQCGLLYYANRLPNGCTEFEFRAPGKFRFEGFPNPALRFHIAVWQSGKGEFQSYTLSNVQILGQGMLNSSSTPLNIDFYSLGSYQISVGGSSIFASSKSNFFMEFWNFWAFFPAVAPALASATLPAARCGGSRRLAAAGSAEAGLWA